MSEYEGVLADTLAMVNVVRGAFGHDPLDELPSAQPGQAGDCVYARAFRDLGARSVGGDGEVSFDNVGTARKVAALVGVESEGGTVPLPTQFRQVIRAFDHGSLPELGVNLRR